MSLGRGSGRSITYIKEVIPNVTPTAPAMTTFRNTGDSFELKKDSFQSSELRADRAVTDLTMGNKQTGGGLDFEWSYTNFDDFLVAALFADTSDLTVGITNGITPHSFTFEKGLPSLNFFQQFTGVMVNKLSLSLQGNSPVTGSLDLIGMGYEKTTATIADSIIPPVSGGLFDSYNLVLKENDIELGVALSLSLNIANNISPAFALGDDSAIDLVDGRCNVDGSMTIYFENSVIYDKFANNTESSLELEISSGANKYTIDLPRVKYTTAGNPVSDEGPINVAMNFQALQDDTAGYTIKITKA